MSLLGATLAAQGKHAEAEQYLIGGYEGLVTKRHQIWQTINKNLPTTPPESCRFLRRGESPTRPHSGGGKLVCVGE